MSQPESQPVTIYTIGHSNLPLERFIDVLRAKGIRTLVDVRSSPFSRFVSHFNRGSLEATLPGAGIEYRFAGETLGGRPSEASLYKTNEVPPPKADYLSLVDYPAVAEQEWFRRGLARLRALAADAPTAIMCSEEDPTKCHRHHLIERALHAGDRVVHIRTKGGVVAEETLSREPAEPSPVQMSLL